MASDLFDMDLFGVRENKNSPSAALLKGAFSPPSKKEQAEAQYNAIQQNVISNLDQLTSSMLNDPKYREADLAQKRKMIDTWEEKVWPSIKEQFAGDSTLSILARKHSLQALRKDWDTEQDRVQSAGKIAKGLGTMAYRGGRMVYDMPSAVDTKAVNALLASARGEVERLEAVQARGAIDGKYSYNRIQGGGIRGLPVPVSQSLTPEQLNQALAEARKKHNDALLLADEYRRANMEHAEARAKQIEQENLANPWLEDLAKTEARLQRTGAVLPGFSSRLEQPGIAAPLAGLLGLGVEQAPVMAGIAAGTVGASILGGPAAGTGAAFALAGAAGAAGGYQEAQQALANIPMEEVTQAPRYQELIKTMDPTEARLVMLDEAASQAAAINGIIEAAGGAVTAPALIAGLPMAKRFLDMFGKSAFRRFLGGTISESAIEGLQEGAQQYSSNAAVNTAVGAQVVDPMEGVFDAAAQAAVGTLPFGAAGAGLQAGAPARAQAAADAEKQRLKLAGLTEKYKKAQAAWPGVEARLKTATTDEERAAIFKEMQDFLQIRRDYTEATGNTQRLAQVDAQIKAINDQIAAAGRPAPPVQVLNKVGQALQQGGWKLEDIEPGLPVVDSLVNTLRQLGASDIADRIAGGTWAAGQDALEQAGLHGTSAENLTGFDWSFIGSGEGSQAFGQGFYLTEPDPVGRDLARFYANAATGTRNKIKLGANTYELRQDSKSGHFRWFNNTTGKVLGPQQGNLVDVLTRLAEPGKLAQMKKTLTRETLNLELGRDLLPALQQGDFQVNKAGEDFQVNDSIQVGPRVFTLTPSGWTSDTGVSVTGMGAFDDLLVAAANSQRFVPLALERLQDRINGDAAYVNHLEKQVRQTERASNKAMIRDTGGKVYQVEIPDNEELLQWDLPFAQQPAQVQARLQALVGARPELQGLDLARTGAGIYTQLARSLGGERAASDALTQAGIPGHRYWDGNTRNSNGTKRHNFVIWDTSKATDFTETLFQEVFGGQKGAPPRAAYQRLQNRLIKILRGPNPDPSSLVHEFMHAFVDEITDLLSHGKVPSSMVPAVTNDIGTILTWAGTIVGTPVATWQDFVALNKSNPDAYRSIHEQIARGFEAYLRTGRAPEGASAELVGAFQRLRVILRKLYADIKAYLGGRLNKDVREVFDSFLLGYEAQPRAPAPSPTAPTVVTPTVAPAQTTAPVQTLVNGAPTPARRGSVTLSTTNGVNTSMINGSPVSQDWQTRINALMTAYNLPHLEAVNRVLVSEGQEAIIETPGVGEARTYDQDLSAELRTIDGSRYYWINRRLYTQEQLDNLNKNRADQGRPPVRIVEEGGVSGTEQGGAAPQTGVETGSAVAEGPAGAVGTAVPGVTEQVVAAPGTDEGGGTGGAAQQGAGAAQVDDTAAQPVEVGVPPATGTGLGVAGGITPGAESVGEPSYPTGELTDAERRVADDSRTEEGYDHELTSREAELADMESADEVMSDTTGDVYSEEMARQLDNLVADLGLDPTAPGGTIAQAQAGETDAQATVEAHNERAPLPASSIDNGEIVDLQEDVGNVDLMDTTTMFQPSFLIQPQDVTVDILEATAAAINDLLGEGLAEPVPAGALGEATSSFLSASVPAVGGYASVNYGSPNFNRKQWKSIGTKARAKLEDSQAPFRVWLAEALNVTTGHPEDVPVIKALSLSEGLTRRTYDSLIATYWAPIDKVIGQWSRKLGMDPIDVATQILGEGATTQHVLQDVSKWERRFQERIAEARALPERSVQQRKKKQDEVLKAEAQLKAYDAFQLDARSAFPTDEAYQAWLNDPNAKSPVATMGGMRTEDRQKLWDKLVAQVAEAGISEEEFRKSVDLVIQAFEGLKQELLSVGVLDQEDVAAWNYEAYVPLQTREKANQISGNDGVIFVNPSRVDFLRQGATHRALDAVTLLHDAMDRTSRQIGTWDFMNQLDQVYDRLAASGDTMGFKRYNEAALRRKSKKNVSAWNETKRIQESGGLVLRKKIIGKNGEPRRETFRYVFEESSVMNAEEAVEMTKAMGVIGAQSPFMAWMSSLTRGVSRFYTMYRPAFAPVNASRDGIERTFITAARDWRKEDGSMVSGLAVARTMMKIVANPLTLGEYAAAFISGKGMGKYGQFFNEFKKSPANFTFTQYLANGPQSLEKVLKNAGTFRRVGKTAFNKIVNGWNDFFNVFPGFMQYAALRSNGVSAKDAAAYTLDTMNFHKKGTLTNPASAFAPFVVSTVQTGANLMRSLSTRGKQTTGQKLRSSAMMTGLFMGASMLLGFLRAGAEDEETGLNRYDDLTFDELAQGMSFFTRDGERVVVPVGFGGPLIAWIGANAWQRASEGKITPGEAAFQVLSATIKNVLPGSYPSYDLREDPTTWFMQFVTPFLFRPLIDLAANKNNWGGQIALADTQRGRGVRKFESGRATTPEVWHNIAKGIYEAVGLDFTPEGVKHFINYYAAGPLQGGVAWMERDSLNEDMHKNTRTQIGPLLSALGVTTIYKPEMNVAQRQYYHQKNRIEARMDRLGVRTSDPANKTAEQKKAFIVNNMLDKGFSEVEVERYLLLLDLEKSLKKIDSNFKRDSGSWFMGSREEVKAKFQTWSGLRSETILNYMSMFPQE